MFGIVKSVVSLVKIAKLQPRTPAIGQIDDGVTYASDRPVQPAYCVQLSQSARRRSRHASYTLGAYSRSPVRC